MKIKILKSRCGTNGVFYNWEYNASIDEKIASDNGIDYKIRSELNRDDSLESLARKLAVLPNSLNLHLTKGDYKESEGVSLVRSFKVDCLTQYGSMTDDEIGFLASLVWRYAVRNME